MKKQILFFALAAFSLFLSSCKIMYVPNTENVPLFKEKNEFRSTISTTNYQGAFAVTNNVGIMLNGQYKRPTWNYTSGNTKYTFESKKTLIEGGVGYFKTLGDAGVFEVYGGGGGGSVSFNRSYSDTMGGPTTIYDRYSAMTTRLFLQPSIGITTDYADFAFSARLVGLKFSNIDSLGYSHSDLLDNNLANLDKQMFGFIEPALTIRVGYKYVKFHMQAILSLPMNTQPINYAPFVFNVGVHVNVAERHKKK